MQPASSPDTKAPASAGPGKPWQSPAHGHGHAYEWAHSLSFLEKFKRRNVGRPFADPGGYCMAADAVAGQGGAISYLHQ